MSVHWKYLFFYEISCITKGYYYLLLLSIFILNIMRWKQNQKTILIVIDRCSLFICAASIVVLQPCIIDNFRFKIKRDKCLIVIVNLQREGLKMNKNVASSSGETELVIRTVWPISSKLHVSIVFLRYFYTKRIVVFS